MGSGEVQFVRTVKRSRRPMPQMASAAWRPAQRDGALVGAGDSSGEPSQRHRRHRRPPPPGGFHHCRGCPRLGGTAVPPPQTRTQSPPPLRGARRRLATAKRSNAADANACGKIVRGTGRPCRLNPRRPVPVSGPGSGLPPRYGTAVTRSNGGGAVPRCERRPRRAALVVGREPGGSRLRNALGTSAAPLVVGRGDEGREEGKGANGGKAAAGGSLGHPRMDSRHQGLEERRHRRYQGRAGAASPCRPFRFRQPTHGPGLGKGPVAQRCTVN